MGKYIATLVLFIILQIPSVLIQIRKIQLSPVNNVKADKISLAIQIVLMVFIDISLIIGIMRHN